MAMSELGAALRQAREASGLSLDALAKKANFSRALLGFLETGVRPVRDQHVRAYRRALNAPPELLHLPGDRSENALNVIRAGLAGYEHLMNDKPRLWPLPQLRNAVVEVHRANKGARYDDAAEMLPDVVSAADAYDGYSGKTAREIQLTRCTSYVAAAKLLTKIGAPDLAWIAADRAAHAAISADSMTARGLAAYEIACAVLKMGKLDEAELVAVGSAERLMPRDGLDNPDSISLAGLLWCFSAVIAARRNRKSDAKNRLVNAENLANRLGRDANHAWTAFGPTNVLIHRASVAVDLEDPLEVKRVVGRIDSRRLPAGLNGRRSQISLNLAYAHSQLGENAEAITSLAKADRIAPESIRYHEAARELVCELLAKSREPSSALSMLAMRIGVA